VLDDFGTLSVRAKTAGGALPVPGAVVRIFGAEEDNRFITYSLLTDEDGAVDKISLPSPIKSLSLSPGAAESPYAIYNIEISAPGYFNKIINGVSVFSGIDSVLPITMIPVSVTDVKDFPRNNLVATVTQNKNLEG
jgi:hypothetical protein